MSRRGGLIHFKCRALVRAGAKGAAEPVNFGQRVHAPVNFQLVSQIICPPGLIWVSPRPLEEQLTKKKFYVTPVLYPKVPNTLVHDPVHDAMF